MMKRITRQEDRDAVEIYCPVLCNAVYTMAPVNGWECQFISSFDSSVKNQKQEPSDNASVSWHYAYFEQALTLRTQQQKPNINTNNAYIPKLAGPIIHFRGFNFDISRMPWIEKWKPSTNSLLLMTHVLPLIMNLPTPSWMCWCWIPWRIMWPKSKPSIMTLDVHLSTWATFTLNTTGCYLNQP